MAGDNCDIIEAPTLNTCMCVRECECEWLNEQQKHHKALWIESLMQPFTMITFSETLSK